MYDTAAAAAAASAPHMGQVRGVDCFSRSFAVLSEGLYILLMLQKVLMQQQQPGYPVWARCAGVLSM
jgi:hypothetical protein